MDIPGFSQAFLSSSWRKGYSAACMQTTYYNDNNNYNSHLLSSLSQVLCSPLYIESLAHPLISLWGLSSFPHFIDQITETAFVTVLSYTASKYWGRVGGGGLASALNLHSSHWTHCFIHGDWHDHIFGWFSFKISIWASYNDSLMPKWSKESNSTLEVLSPHIQRKRASEHTFFTVLEE